MNDWIIGVSPWVITDGNYSDFFCDQVVKFGLELSLKETVTSDSNIKIATPIIQNKYQVIGKIMDVTSKSFILDFGVAGYKKFKTAPPYAKIGQYISSQISISIDPFFMKDLLLGSSYEDLIYTWKINRIIKELTPFILEKDSKGVNVGKYIHSEAKHTAVSQTDALNDGVGSSYFLHCTKVDFPLE